VKVGVSSKRHGSPRKRCVLDRANAHIHKEQNIRLSLPDDEEILWSNETDLKESRGDKK
jgi:hypothetical protein